MHKQSIKLKIISDLQKMDSSTQNAKQLIWPKTGLQKNTPHIILGNKDNNQTSLAIMIE